MLSRFVFSSLFILAAAVSRAENPPQVVSSVDLARYAGTWYELARMPNWFQKKCVGDVTATYILQTDGTIKVINRCRKGSGNLEEAEGVAKLANPGGPNTKLKVRFAPAFLSPLSFVWGDYWILALAEDYSYAVVGDPARKYLWVLARTPSLDESTWQTVRAAIAQAGYDVSALIPTSHTGR